MTNNAMAIITIIPITTNRTINQVDIVWSFDVDSDGDVLVALVDDATGDAGAGLTVEVAGSSDGVEVVVEADVVEAGVDDGVAVEVGVEVGVETGVATGVGVTGSTIVPITA
jgi:hypothetical protein